MLALIFILFFQPSSYAEPGACSLGLVSQFDPKLLEAFPTSPGLCSATCIGNLLTLIKDELHSNGPKNVIRVVRLIQKSTQHLEAYDPNKEGVSFIQMIKTLTSLARKPGSKIKYIEVKANAALTPEDQLMIKSEAKYLSFKNVKTQPGDLKKTKTSWMILGVAGWLGRNKYSKYSHDVLAKWDELSQEVLILDPANPEKLSRWKFIKGTVENPARLQLVEGKFYKQYGVIVVEEWVKILTKN